MKNIIKFAKLGFDNDKYLRLQSEAILKRQKKFKHRLYLEIGGHFEHDAHASRVLPGFLPDNKIRILKLLGEAEIIYCINAKDIEMDRQFNAVVEHYPDYLISALKNFEKLNIPKPKIAINMYKNEYRKTDQFIKRLDDLNYTVAKRYIIDNYPNDLDLIASKDGYGKDDYIDVNSSLVVVMGPGSNNGKMSTCLGQVYHDNMRDIDSGYAKYETFPIWNFPLEHPVNYAYEAATADIGDYNAIDVNYFHKFGEKSVNYNRDIEAFPIVKNLCRRVTNRNNFMNTYSSPTEMGISNAGFAVSDDMLVRKTSREEIIRRYFWYKFYLKNKKVEQKSLDKIEEIMKKIKLLPDEIEVVRVARKEHKASFQFMDETIQVFNNVKELISKIDPAKLSGSVVHSPVELASNDRVKLENAGVVYTDE